MACELSRPCGGLVVMDGDFLRMTGRRWLKCWGAGHTLYVEPVARTIAAPVIPANKHCGVCLKPLPADAHTSQKYHVGDCQKTARRAHQRRLQREYCDFCGGMVPLGRTTYCGSCAGEARALMSGQTAKAVGA